jgi:hypothetical protein
MTVLDPTNLDLPDLQRQLVGRLEDFGRRVRLHLLAEGAARVLAVAVALALVSFLLDRWLRLGLATRLILLALGLTVIAIEAWRHLVTPLRLKLSPVALAAVLDRRGNGSATFAPPLASRVASVLQLPDLLRGTSAPSEAMVRRAVARSHESLRDITFSDRLDRRRLQASYAIVAFLLLLPAALTLASPPTAGLWFKRWFLGSNVPWPQRTYLTVPGLSGNKMLVPRGEPSVLIAGVREGSEEPESVAVKIRDARGGKSGGPMTKFGPGDFRYDLPPLQSPVKVTLEGGDDELGPFTIEPVDRPRIVSLTLESKHPADPEARTHAFSGHDADVAYLPRTDLKLRFVANVPVAEARMKTLQAKPGTPEVPSPSNLRRLDDRSFEVRWTHEQPVSVEIELIGKVGGLTSTPTPVAIGLKADQPPRVSLAYSGVRARVTPQARIPLTVQSRDDYGLAKVELAIRAEAAPVDPSASPTTGPSTAPTTAPATAAPPAREAGVVLMGPASPAVELETQHRHALELARLSLTPGALVSVAARATDACYTGPQTSQSRTVTFRVVAPEELFREILLRQQAERAKFRKQIEEAQRVRSALATSVSDDAIANAGRQQRLVQREANRIAGSLAESLTELKLNALGGQEAYDLMEQKILKPLKALNDELMEPQRDALDKLGRPADPKRLTEAAARQEQIVARMQEILKQMAQWDSFVDVLNQLNEIIRIQQQAKSATEQIKDKDTESLFK